MTVKIMIGDVREQIKLLPSESVHCVVTSPPYWGLRDYGCEGQIGLEETPQQFVAEMVDLFREVRRVLRDDGTLWLNMGDSYAGSRAWVPPPFGLKQKDLVGMPWRCAFALQADGWYLRQDIIWSKPNPMPESIGDRCTKAHEYLFLFAKNGGNPLLYRARDTREWQVAPNLSEMMADGETPRWRGFDYYYDADAIAERRIQDEDAATFRGGCYVGGEIGNGYMGKRKVVGNRRVRLTDSANDSHVPGAPSHSKLHRAGTPRETEKRNKRSVWTVPTSPFSEGHFATFPPALIKPCILAGCPEGGVVLDPFGGAGTTGLVADRMQRNAILIEINPAYAAMARRRIDGDSPLFARAAE